MRRFIQQICVFECGSCGKSGPKFVFLRPKFGEGLRHFFEAFVNRHHFRPTGQVWLRSHGWYVFHLSCMLTNLKKSAVKYRLQHSKCQQVAVTITTPLLLVICHSVVRIDVAYSCAKFDDFRFSRSSDMTGAPKLL